MSSKLADAPIATAPELDRENTFSAKVSGALAQVLRQLRMTLGESQEQFAHRVQSSVRTIARWEGGQSSPSVPAIVKLTQIAESNGVHPVAAVLADSLAMEIGTYQLYEFASRVQVWNTAMAEIEAYAYSSWEEIAENIEVQLTKIRDANKDNVQRYNELEKLVSQVHQTTLTPVAEFEKLIATRSKVKGIAREAAIVEILSENPDLCERLKRDRDYKVHRMSAMTEKR
jgi:transcriptional regulator with XRE-family HTH domain